MRTQEEIQAEIAALTACLEYAPKVTAFGDDNHQKINWQIEALRDPTTIEDKIDEAYADEEADSSLPKAEALQEVQGWLEGDVDESPSSGWAMYKK